MDSDWTILYCLYRLHGSSEMLPKLMKLIWVFSFNWLRYLSCFNNKILWLSWIFSWFMYLGREVKLVVQCLEKIFVHLFSMIRLNLRNSGLIWCLIMWCLFFFAIWMSFNPLKVKPKISTRDPARDCWFVPRGNWNPDYCDVTYIKVNAFFSCFLR